MVDIDWASLTDEELDQVQSEAHTETARRRIPVEMNRLNAEYITGQGLVSGDPWRAPEGSHDAYPLGWVVTHNGATWQSLVAGNVWEPPTSWREVTEGVPAWVQPTGAHDAYKIGDEVTHVEKTWVSTVDNNVWEPGVYGWDEKPAPTEPEPPAPEVPIP